MNQLSTFFFDAQNQLQLGLTIFVLVISFLMRWATRRAIKRAHLHQKHKVVGQMVEFIKPVFVPSFALILMTFVYFTLDHLQIDARVIKILSQFIIIWLVLAALHVSTNSRFAQWSIVLFILPIIGLGTSGLLKPFTKFLESFYFKFGGAKISLYSVFLSIVTFILLIWIARLITRGLDAYLHKFHTLRASNRELILKAASIALYFVVGLSALEMLGIDLTALAVFGGAIGVGVGFGLQKITSNFISGIILLFEKSVEVDDLIELADGTYGFIRHTGARATLVETTDGKEIMIPNEDFITSRVTNWTYSNTRGRVEMVIGVSYQSDLKKAQQLMLDAAAEHSRCSKHPDKQPLCHLIAFADSSVQFKLTFWVDDVKLGRAGPKSDVLFSIWDKFKEQGVDVPYPHQEIYIKELPRIEPA
ncbi:MAG: mechanosensitive ion channel [Rickettsiales bacterium]